MERQAADDGAEPRLGYLLKHAYLAYGEMSRTALEPHGVDGRDLAVLALIGRHDPMSQRDLANLLSVDRTTMVGLVDGLERRSLVTRRPAPDDRRKNIVELTASGRRTLKSAGKAADEVERRFLSALTAADARRFRAALHALTRNPG
ncbi:MAG TPA: MarR family transcriptional regulator [Streptosporangiaceae bacterium]|jgi:DNA-binding MarR family transcriptional regulator